MFGKQVAGVFLSSRLGAKESFSGIFADLKKVMGAHTGLLDARITIQDYALRFFCINDAKSIFPSEHIRNPQATFSKFPFFVFKFEKCSLDPSSFQFLTQNSYPSAHGRRLKFEKSIVSGVLDGDKLTVPIEFHGSRLKGVHFEGEFQVPLYFKNDCLLDMTSVESLVKAVCEGRLDDTLLPNLSLKVENLSAFMTFMRGLDFAGAEPKVGELGAMMDGVMRGYGVSFPNPVALDQSGVQALFDDYKRGSEFNGARVLSIRVQDNDHFLSFLKESQFSREDRDLFLDGLLVGGMVSFEGGASNVAVYEKIREAFPGYLGMVEASFTGRYQWYTNFRFSEVNTSESTLRYLILKNCKFDGNFFSPLKLVSCMMDFSTFESLLRALAERRLKVTLDAKHPLQFEGDRWLFLDAITQSKGVIDKKVTHPLELIVMENLGGYGYV